VKKVLKAMMGNEALKVYQVLEGHKALWVLKETLVLLVFEVHKDL
jgi:hypothetical protein